MHLPSFLSSVFLKNDDCCIKWLLWLSSLTAFTRTASVVCHKCCNAIQGAVLKLAKKEEGMLEADVLVMCAYEQKCTVSAHVHWESAHFV
jgi:hypothetical protein